MGGAGTTTSALAFGGTPGSKNETELWNGTNWTEVNNLNTARQGPGGVGADNTAVLAIGGYSTTYIGNTESWNGTNWTEVNDLTTARAFAAAAGTTPSALAFGGEESPQSAKTEEWNGASWAEVADLNTARNVLGGAGNVTAGLAFAGEDPSGNLTEEWSSSSNVVKTLID